MNGAFENPYFRGQDFFVSVRKLTVGWSAVTVDLRHHPSCVHLRHSNGDKVLKLN